MPDNSPFDLLQFARDSAFPKPIVLGSNKEGVYIQVGMGLGFYVSQSAHDAAKARANQTRRVHFLAELKGGGFVCTEDRDSLLRRSDLVGCIAWIYPDLQ